VACAIASLPVIAGCDPLVNESPSTRAPEPTPSASPSVTQASPAVALARIDLGNLTGEFTSFVGDVPGVMPAMTSGDGLLSVHATIFEQKVPEGTFSVWGADPEHACVEYVTPAVTLYAAHPFATIATGPCPANFRDAGKLKPPKYSQPGIYRAFDVAPAKGPCFYESSAEFPGTGKGDAWVLVDCKGSKWNQKIVGGRFATEAEYRAGFDDAFGEKLCRAGWDRAEKAGAAKLNWAWPTDSGWSHGQRGVLCLAEWKKH